MAKNGACGDTSSSQNPCRRFCARRRCVSLQEGADLRQDTPGPTEDADLNANPKRVVSIVAMLLAVSGTAVADIR